MLDLGNGYVSTKPPKRGAFSEVYFAKKRGNEYAVKVIRCPDERAARNAAREVQILKELKHPNILHYVESYNTTTSVRIVTEYCSKGTLIDYVKTYEPSQEKQLEIFYQLGGAIKYLHENTRVRAHRDLKPDNILVTAGGIIKVADFGLAKVWGHSSSGSGSLYWSYESYYLQSAVGTRAFAAPEVFNEHYTQQSDIFSLGLIFGTVTEQNYRRQGYVYATRGPSPYVGESLHLRKGSSPESLGVQFLQTPTSLSRLILSMLQSNYHARPTARKVKDTLRVLGQSSPPRAPASRGIAHAQQNTPSWFSWEEDENEENVSYDNGELVSNDEEELVSDDEGELVTYGIGEFKSYGTGELVSDDEGELVSDDEGEHVGLF